MAETLEARIKLRRWPKSPNPVTSVAAVIPLLIITLAASAFSVVIESTAIATTFSGACTFLIAVAITPEPIGLVRTSASPARAELLVTILAGSTSPMATSPYFGSSSSTLCPPRIGTPTDRMTSEPPRMISSIMPSERRRRGKPTRFRTKSGFAPIAYMSESALVAAIRPKSYGSSTTGVKKSAVTTRARSSVRRYTAASSPVVCPTRTFGSSTGRT